MKRLWMVLGTLAILAPVTTASAEPYVWTISASDTDPYVNTSAPGNTSLYLWFACSAAADGDQRGMTAAEFGLEVSGGAVFSILPRGQFIVLSTDNTVTLSTGGCPSGPVLAAQMFVSDPGMEICFVPSDAHGILGTLDCGAMPQLHPMGTIGFSSLGAPCQVGDCLGPISVDSESWGGVKGFYH